MSELEATIMMIRVVEIQKGPYKSGLCSITCRKDGLSNKADFARLYISSYSTSKYCLCGLDKRNT